jgi:enterochelin esterase-like enzyme
MNKSIPVALASVCLLAAQAQDSPRPKNTYHSSGGASAAPRLISPEVTPGRTIVFRLRAPEAKQVSLSFAGSKPMTKDSSGVWTATAGPVAPEIYQYNFVVDGVRILDPGNPNLKNGRALDASIVEVPGNPPRFDEVQAVPHGALQIRMYQSTPLKKPRRLYVYTPPQYDTEPGRRFPVLYLRHGSGDTEENWSDMGRAGVILDNLIAQRMTVPMIVVMPNGDTDGTWTGGSSPEAIELLSQELLTDIIPMIEKTYRTAAGSDNRAITGLSMGGGQAFTMGLKHMDQFAWVGEFSSGLVSDTEFKLDKHLPGFLEHAEEANRKLKLLFLSCGTEDPRYPGQLDLGDALKQHNIRYVWYATPGAHEWKVWRHSLYEFAQRAFQPAVTMQTPATLKSPEVAADHRVTFRIRAPKASEVTLAGDWLGNAPPAKLVKDDNGIWSVTLGPFEPSIYIYSFTVDGLSIADPINPRMKLRASTSASLLEVKDDPPAFWEAHDVPHGAVEINWEKAKTINGETRAIWIYTPPGYEKNTRRYPVLYLLHGSNDTAAGWTTAGNANFVFDNLLADKKMVPMIVVMPFGHAAPFGVPTPPGGMSNDALFESYLLEDVIPTVEDRYRVAPGRQNRAIAGLSMGAGQSIRIGLGHLDRFSFVASFSGAVPGDFETRFADLLKDPQATNGKLKALWIGCGQQDSLFGRSKNLSELLTKYQIKHTFRATDGVHNYTIWRKYLAEYAPLLFKE